MFYFDNIFACKLRMFIRNKSKLKKDPFSFNLEKEKRHKSMEQGAFLTRQLSIISLYVIH